VLDPEGLAGGDAAHNAAIMRKVLAGHHVGHGERYEAILQAAAMTAALGLELRGKPDCPGA
jgi:anthranilate phosphoribosyltransferase